MRLQHGHGSSFATSATNFLQHSLHHVFQNIAFILLSTSLYTAMLFVGWIHQVFGVKIDVEKVGHRKTMRPQGCLLA